MERLKKRSQDEHAWKNEGSRKQYKRLEKARATLEKVDDYVHTNVKEGSEAGKDIKNIVKEGMAALA